MIKLSKIYLSNLSNSELLQGIASVDPTLILYICFLGDPQTFASHILDDEIDCRRLAQKWDLTVYNPPKERRTHRVNCILRAPGRRIYNELKKEGTCEEFLKFFQQEDENGIHVSIDRSRFNHLFREKFSFEKDPDEIIRNKIKEIETEFYLNLPPPNYQLYAKNHEITLKYSIVLEKINFILEIACHRVETQRIEIPFEQNHFSTYLPYNMITCTNCNESFKISYDFFHLIH